MEMEKETKYTIKIESGDLISQREYEVSADIFPGTQLQQYINCCENSSLISVSAGTGRIEEGTNSTRP
jgi:hypothetical protein